MVTYKIRDISIAHITDGFATDHTITMNDNSDQALSSGSYTSLFPRLDPLPAVRPPIT